MLKPSGRRGMRYVAGVLLALGLVIPTVAPAVEPLRIESSEGGYFPTRHSFYMEDPGGRLTLEDVSSPAFREKWVPANQDTLNFGFTHSVYWVRFDVRGQAGRENMLLEVLYPLLDYINFYAVRDGRLIQEKPEGDMRPFSDREIFWRNAVFEIDAADSSTFYLRFKSESSMEMPLALWTKNEFAKKTNSELLLFGIYYGMLLVMVLYNLLLAISVRERLYLYYVLYIVSAILTQATLHGLTAQYLWKNSPLWVNMSLPFWLNMDLFWGTVFCSRFLNTKEHLPRLHRVILGILGLTLVGSAVVFVAGYAAALKFTVLLLLIIPVLLFAAGVVSYTSGVKIARIFLVAWAVLLVAIAIAALKAAGFLPTNFFTEYAVQIGTALEITLLSLALADRINFMEKAREEALSLQLIESEKVASLSSAFKKFVPHEFLECLSKEDITKIELGDNVHRVMSVLFADIRSFTTMSESMSPDENFRFINSYLSRMQPIISRHNGFIDKYLGDAIMALFDKSSDDALLTAIEMQQALVEYNDHRRRSGYAPVRIGVGINTGPLMLGIIGGIERLEGTVIADAVNLASRIEGLTKVYGASILISEHTFMTLSDASRFSIRAIDRVMVRGKSEAVTLYEVLDGDTEESRQKKLETLSLFQQGISLYRQLRFDQGLDVFRQCLQVDPDDRAVQTYVQRSSYYMKHGWKGNSEGITVIGEGGFSKKL